MNKQTDINSVKDFIDFIEELIEGVQKEEQRNYNSKSNVEQFQSEQESEKIKKKRERPLDIAIKTLDNKIVVAIDINRMDNIEIDIIPPQEIDFTENLYDNLSKIKEETNNNFLLIKFKAKNKTLDSFIEEANEKNKENQDMFEEIEVFISLEGINPEKLNLDKIKYKKDKENNVLILTIPMLKNKKQTRKFKIS